MSNWSFSIPTLIDSGANWSWTAEITRRLLESNRQTSASLSAFAFLSSPALSFFADVLGWQRINRNCSACTSPLGSPSGVIHPPRGPIYKQLTTCHEQAHAGHEKKRFLFVAARCSSLKLMAIIICMYICVCVQKMYMNYCGAAVVRAFYIKPADTHETHINLVAKERSGLSLWRE